MEAGVARAKVPLPLLRNSRSNWPSLLTRRSRSPSLSKSPQATPSPHMSSSMLGGVTSVNAAGWAAAAEAIIARPKAEAPHGPASARASRARPSALSTHEYGRKARLQGRGRLGRRLRIMRGFGDAMVVDVERALTHKNEAGEKARVRARQKSTPRRMHDPASSHP